MNPRIRRLDSLTIDKIAAGEVVDIPASCVKELVDNALDAGATEIVVEIQLGGRESIRITDNGCGMSQEELCLAIERHSTSKLQKIEDFDRITSLGFRGEALAAIVAVSHMTIRSAQTLGAAPLCQGAVLIAKGGKVESVKEAQVPVGTCVEVSSLFYNVPARRKFLKSPLRDTQEIVKTLTNIALAVPHVSFRLVADGKSLLFVEKDHDVEARIRALLKDPFQTDGLSVTKSCDGVDLRGLIVSPTHTRSTRSGQHVIVNGRHVYSLPISYAVRSGYGTTCESGRHPLFVLQLTLDPSSVDVNIHPQKREVRFSNEEWLKKYIQGAVQEVLFGYSDNIDTFLPIPYSSSSDERTGTEYEPFFRDDSTVHQEQFSLPIPERIERCLAVVGDCALFSDEPTAILVLDLRQAMRAIITNDLKSEKTSSEPLLLPITLNYAPDEANLLNSSLSHFDQLGFSIRPFGPQHFLVEALPSGIVDVDVHTLILEILREGIFALQRSRDLFCKRYAALYVAAMKGFSSPISPQIALDVYKQWKARGSPQFAPDGSTCVGHLTEGVLQELVSKGALLLQGTNI